MFRCEILQSMLYCCLHFQKSNYGVHVCLQFSGPVIVEDTDDAQQLVQHQGDIAISLEEESKLEVEVRNGSSSSDQEIHVSDTWDGMKI